MATDVILGKAMTLTYDSKVIARCTDFTLEVNKEPIDITTLQSASGWKEKKVDLKEWSISFNALVTRGADGTYSVYDELLADIRGTDTAIAVSMDDTDGSGTISVGGDVFLTSLSTGVTVGDKVTYSGTLEGTGALA
jgi:predicted secreted protein